jgi:hypothetical protein
MLILVAIESVDLRKGIDGLAQLCREKLGADPFSGYLFIFRSRRATAVKILAYATYNLGLRDIYQFTVRFCAKNDCRTGAGNLYSVGKQIFRVPRPVCDEGFPQICLNSLVCLNLNLNCSCIGYG